MKKISALLGASAVATALALAPSAHATPGQCSQSPWGGFCDSFGQRGDGSYYHCENVLGFSNCFWVRPVSVDVDPRGWVPA